MRLLTKKSAGSYLPLFLAFVLPALIVFAAYMAAQIEPGKILPVDATLRRKEADQDLISAVTEETGVIESYRSGDPDSITVLITEYLDPFTVPALLLEGRSLEILLMTAFFLRFGLAGFSMYLLLKRRFGAAPYFKVLFSVLYGVSSVCLGASGSVSGMDLMILLPFLAGALYDGTADLDTGNKLKIVLFSFLVSLSGLPGLLTGLIAILAFSIYSSCIWHGEIYDITVSSLKASLLGVSGILISGIVNVPRLHAMNISGFPEKLFENGKVNYKLFDLISNAASGMAVTSRESYVPAVYTGIITMALIIMLFLNRKVPLRIKATLGMIMIFIYASVSYSPIERILSLFVPSYVYISSRIGVLAVLVIISAVMSLDYMKGAQVSLIYGSGFIILAVLVIANSSENIYGFMNYQLFMTFLSAVAVTCFLIHERSKASRGGRICWAIVSILAVTANVSYVFMMSDVDPADYRICEYKTGKTDESVITDVDGVIPILGDEDSYVLLNRDQFSPVSGDSVASSVNRMASGLMIGEIFTPFFTEELVNNGFEYSEGYRYRISGEGSELVLGVDNYEGFRLFISSGFAGHTECAVLNYDLDDPGSEDAFEAPFIKEIRGREDSFEVSLYADEMDQVSEFGIYTVDEQILAEFTDRAGRISDGRFTITGPIYAESTVITGIPYDGGITVTVDGRRADTYSFLGRLSFDPSSIEEGSVVQLKRADNSLLYGTLSALAGAAVCAAFVFIKKDRRKDYA
ncbi:MAG: YfhO family protein [Clostridiales bacterium]|nr:YfhO family protein [Clostridiales bacterium]